MDESPAMLFYAEKFYSGTADMKPETVGIYIRLLSKLWDMPDGLPNDSKKLARLALVSEKKFKESWESDYLCEKFILNDKNNLTNERIEIVRGERLKKSEKTRESVLKRWEKEKYERNTNVIQTNNERNTNDIHISKENSIINNTIKEKEDNKPYTPTPKVDWNNIQLPIGFGDEFKKAWEEFEQHRKELQETYSAPARQNAIMGLIRDMATNEKRCIECLRYAIGKNWKHPNTQLFKEHNPVSVTPEVKTLSRAHQAERKNNG